MSLCQTSEQTIGTKLSVAGAAAWRTAIVLISILQLTVLPASAQRGKTVQEQYQASVKKFIAQLERQLEVQLKLQRSGVSSAATVDRVRVDLAKARYDLAVVQRDDDKRKQQATVLRNIRERELNRLQDLRTRGHNLEFQFVKAQRRLAMSRFMDLRLKQPREAARDALLDGVQLCEQEVALWQKALDEKMATRAEVSYSRNRLACARYQLGKMDKNAEARIPELVAAVERFQDDWDQVLRLKKQGAATVLDELIVRSSLLNARIRLENERDHKDEVKTLLSELVQVDEKALELVRKPGFLMFVTRNAKQVIRNALVMELAHDQLRLHIIDESKELADDLTLSVLDP